MSPIVTLELLLALMNTMESTSAEMIRSGLFSTVRIESSGYQCIADVPSIIETVSRYLQCAEKCNGRDGCYDFNVIDGGNGDRKQCQLYIAKDPLHYDVRTGCRSYQV